MVVAMDADLVSPGAGQTHHAFVSPADVRAGQKQAVQKRADAVSGNHAGAADLAQEPGTEDALDRAAGVVGTEGEEKRGLDVERVQEVQEIGPPYARAPVRVHVDLYGENGIIHTAFWISPSPRPISKHPSLLPPLPGGRGIKERRLYRRRGVSEGNAYSLSSLDGLPR